MACETHMITLKPHFNNEPEILFLRIKIEANTLQL